MLPRLWLLVGSDRPTNQYCHLLSCPGQLKNDRKWLWLWVREVKETIWEKRENSQEKSFRLKAQIRHAIFFDGPGIFETNYLHFWFQRKCANWDKSYVFLCIWPAPSDASISQSFQCFNDSDFLKTWQTLQGLSRSWIFFENKIFGCKFGRCQCLF